MASDDLAAGGLKTASAALNLVTGGAQKKGSAVVNAVESKVEALAALPYKRPHGATTEAQREAVQGMACVKCGATTDKQIAGHKRALVKEHYETGTIDKQRMRSKDSVQPECPTCSAREGAEMARYSREMKKELGL
jgi:hypothetical protein